MSRARRRALGGTWAGYLNQDVGAPFNDGNIRMRLKCGWRTIHGTGEYELVVNGATVAAEFRFSGGFRFDRFVMLEYKNAKDHVVQFGAVVLELSDESDCLAGRYAGYGSISKTPVSGAMSLRRFN